MFFLQIFMLTLALGGMSDERVWGLPCWIALGCAGLLVLPLAFGLNDPIGVLALALLPLHGLATAFIARGAAGLRTAGTQRDSA